MGLDMMSRAWGSFLGMIAPLVVRKGITYGSSDGDFSNQSEGTVTSDLYLADIITSRIGEGSFHKVLLDIDSPSFLIESSTPGHYHLYIDQAVEWDKLKVVLSAMADAGIIEEGYAEACMRRGYTSLRPPWRVKGDESPVALYAGVVDPGPPPF